MVALRIDMALRKSSLGYNPRVSAVLAKYFGETRGRIIASSSDVVTFFTGRVDPTRLKTFAGKTPESLAAIRELRKGGLISEKLSSRISYELKTASMSLGITLFGGPLPLGESIQRIARKSENAASLNLTFFKAVPEGTEDVFKRWGQTEGGQRPNFFRKLTLAEQLEIFENLDFVDRASIFHGLDSAKQKKLFGAISPEQKKELVDALSVKEGGIQKLFNSLEVADRHDLYKSVDKKGMAKILEALDGDSLKVLLKEANAPFLLEAYLELYPFSREQILAKLDAKSYEEFAGRLKDSQRSSFLQTIPVRIFVKFLWDLSREIRRELTPYALTKKIDPPQFLDIIGVEDQIKFFGNSEGKMQAKMLCLFEEDKRDAFLTALGKDAIDKFFGSLSRLEPDTIEELLRHLDKPMRAAAFKALTPGKVAEMLNNFYPHQISRFLIALHEADLLEQLCKTVTLEKDDREKIADALKEMKDRGKIEEILKRHWGNLA